MSEEPLTVPDEVYRQLEATRESGVANMMTEIDSALRELGFDAAAEWVENNREDYYQHALRGGFVPVSESKESLPADEVK